MYRMRAFIHRMRYSYARYYFTNAIRKIGYDISILRISFVKSLFIYNTCVIHTSHLSFIYRTWSKCVRACVCERVSACVSARV